MNTKGISILVVLVLLFTGCASMEQNPGTATGAGVGAAAGAAVGGAIGRSAGSAVLGGLLGGLAGGLIGHYYYDQKKNREDTQKTYPTGGGELMKIENVAVSPKTVSPGDQVNLDMTYALLTPSGKGTEVTETREILHNGTVVGNPQVRVQRADGTYTSDIPLKLPENAQKGDYTVKMSANSGQGSDTKVANFTVR